MLHSESMWTNCSDVGVAPPVRAGVFSPSFLVGNNFMCDRGPLMYYVTDVSGSNVKMTVTFRSSVVEDASPPSCTISWDRSDLLTQPFCYVMDSREGYHLTSYWIRLIGELAGHA
eukprot:TRINITY_DN3005_c0_g1_i3.p1 TRINITY_DN3005_c0_g1~~TRINITY_DN3005_c0_g1_i3.p1  ORF type:complete len:115 (-),score=11.18 TRINITY_DN3005_c0_g1_i3:107-451(-)